jgi:hypothetical protein
MSTFINNLKKETDMKTKEVMLKGHKFIVSNRKNETFALDTATGEEKQLTHGGTLGLGLILKMAIADKFNLKVYF